MPARHFDGIMKSHIPAENAQIRKQCPKRTIYESMARQRRNRPFWFQRVLEKEQKYEQRMNLMMRPLIWLILQSGTWGNHR